MKILHTSDWHLGRTLHGYSLLEDQRYMIEQVFETIIQQKIDVCVIAGDVYDKAVPNEEAVAVFNTFLKRMILELKIPTVIIAGNHDSNTRIHFGSELFNAQGLYIVGKAKKGYEKIILGDEEKVAFYLIPYMEPAEVRAIADDETIKRHDDAMRYLTQQIEQSHQEEVGAAVVVAHAFVAGGDLSDSERRLCSVGTAEMVGADCFKNFTYTALGHLHKGQAMGANFIRYSGSPIKYSVSEANQPKGITCITIEGGVLVEVQEHPLKALRDLRVIEGPIESLVAAGVTLSEDEKNDYVYARLTDKEGEDVVGTLRKVYPYILGAEFVQQNNGKAVSSSSQSRFEKKRSQTVTSLFQEFIDFVGDVALEEDDRVYMQKLIQDIEEGKHEA